jgi:hypothetical protein
VGAGCWPGLVALDGGTLRIDTLRVGPAVIQGGLPPDVSVRRRGIAAGSAVVGRLVVSAGTVTRLVFLADGIYLHYNQLEVICEFCFLFSHSVTAVFGNAGVGRTPSGELERRLRSRRRSGGDERPGKSGRVFRGWLAGTWGRAAGGRLCSFFLQQLSGAADVRRGARSVSRIGSL